MLSDAETTFAKVFDLAPLFLAITSLETGKFVAVNDAFVTLCGYTRAEAIGRSSLELGLWADLEAHDEGLAQLREGRAIDEREVHLHLKNGEVRAFLLSAKVIDFGGKACILNAAVDVSRRTQAERRATESEARYRDLFNSTDEGFCVIDVLFEGERAVDYRFLEANPKFEEQTGLRDVVGKTVLELVPGLESHWFEFYGAVVQTGEPRRFENSSAALGRWFDVYAFRIDVGEGRGHHVAVFFKDVSERKQAEHALAALTRELEEKVEARTKQVRDLAAELTLAEARERSRLAQVLHDELQQQLYAAQFALGGLRSHLREHTPVLDGGLVEKLDELKELIGGALSISRTTTANLSPPVLRHEGLLEALEWLAGDMAARHGLLISVDAPDTLPVPNEAVRVLLFNLGRELLFNVVKHAEVAQATVTLRKDDDRFTLSVHDLGRGFDPAVLTERASGLGLSGVRNRLELFGGRLELVSAPHKGARVTITVPASLLR